MVTTVLLDCPSGLLPIEPLEICIHKAWWSDCKAGSDLSIWAIWLSWLIIRNCLPLHWVHGHSFEWVDNAPFQCIPRSWAWLHSINPLCKPPTLLNKIELAMKLRQENDFWSKGLTGCLNNWLNIRKIGLIKHQSMTATLCLIWWTLETLTSSWETRCVCVASFDKNLSHSLKPSSTLVALRKVKWLGGALWQLCVSHLNFFFDHIPIAIMNAFH